MKLIAIEQSEELRAEYVAEISQYSPSSRDDVLDAVWAAVGDLIARSPMQCCEQPVLVHTENGTAARCTSQGV